MSYYGVTFKPGEIAPVSGQYLNTGTGYEVTVTAGEPFPPTDLPGQVYTLVDPTRHRSNM